MAIKKHEATNPLIKGKGHKPNTLRKTSFGGFARALGAMLPFVFGGAAQAEENDNQGRGAIDEPIKIEKNFWDDRQIAQYSHQAKTSVYYAANNKLRIDQLVALAEKGEFTNQELAEINNLVEVISEEMSTYRVANRNSVDLLNDIEGVKTSLNQLLGELEEGIPGITFKKFDRSNVPNY